MNAGRRTICVVALALSTVMASCGSTVRRSPLTSQPRGAGSGQDSSLTAPTGAPADSALAGLPGSAGGTGSSGGGRGTGGAKSSGAIAGPGGSTRSPSIAARGPIELGFLYAVNDGAQSAGINNGNTFTLQQVQHAFVDTYNASGGIGGRHINPVYAELHSASSDYEGQAQAACASFTQDHHVSAVMSNVGYHSDTLVSCLGKATVPLITGDWDAPDQQDARRLPLFITPTALLGDTRVIAVVSHLAASGFLQTRNRIGVVVEDCPINQRVYQNALVPALRNASLTLAATYRPRCFQSIQDYGGQASDIQAAVLQFNRTGVDRVLFVSEASEANIMGLFAQGADAQHYLPGYALSSIAAPAILALNAPASQLANAQGVGWLPQLDTQDSAQAPPTPTAKRCLSQMKKQGIQPTSNADFTNVYGPCDTFTLYDELLRASNGDAGANAVVQALNKVGGSYVSASTVEGRVTMKGGRIGAAMGRLFAFGPTQRFEYTSAPFPL
jgi:hypothetical protein